MKKVLIGLFAMVFAYSAQASVRFFDGSNVDLGHQQEIKCGTNVSCAQTSGKMVVSVVSASFTGDLVGDGGDQLYGFLQEQVASTSTSITAAQCGSTFVSNSADVMTLPEASTVLGCRLTFVCGTADDFDINPADATDAFGPINSVAAGTGAAITPSAGDAIRCTDIGSSIVIEAVGASLWVPVGVANGAWTDVN